MLDNEPMRDGRDREKGHDRGYVRNREVKDALSDSGQHSSSYSLHDI